MSDLPLPYQNYLEQPSKGLDSASPGWRSPAAAEKFCDETDGEWEIVLAPMMIEMQQQMEVIQGLIAAQGTSRYGAIQQQAARKLGISVRSVQRLVKTWHERGLSGLTKQARSDQGAVVKISAQWYKFILRTYRDGNRGSQQMTPAQVALRVRAHAENLRVQDYPSRTTIYRVLQPQIKRQQQKRSLG